jgi:hypothetical protein
LRSQIVISSPPGVEIADVLVRACVVEIRVDVVTSIRKNRRYCCNNTGIVAAQPGLWEFT